MIRAVFCKSSLPGSILISWGTKDAGQSIKDTPSHVAFRFFSDIVIDSTLTDGVRESTYGKLDKKYDIVKEITVVTDQEKSYGFLDKARGMIVGSSYDWPAIMYFSWRVFLKKVFDIPIPKKNKLAVPSMHFCTEVYNIISGKDHGMVSPNDLMKLLEKK